MILIKAVNTVVYKEAVYIRLSVLFFVAMTIHGGYFSILSVSNIQKVKLFGTGELESVLLYIQMVFITLPFYTSRNAQAHTFRVVFYGR